MGEASLSKLDDKGVFTIVKVESVERKVGKETITEVNIETEEEFYIKKVKSHSKEFLINIVYEDNYNNYYIYYEMN